MATSLKCLRIYMGYAMHILSYIQLDMIYWRVWKLKTHICINWLYVFSDLDMNVQELFQNLYFRLVDYVFLPLPRDPSPLFIGLAWVEYFGWWGRWLVVQASCRHVVVVAEAAGCLPNECVPLLRRLPWPWEAGCRATRKTKPLVGCRRVQSPNVGFGPLIWGHTAIDRNCMT